MGCFSSIRSSRRRTSVTVELTGFKKYEQKDIRVFANDRIDLTEIILMAVGGCLRLDHRRSARRRSSRRAARRKAAF